MPFISKSGNLTIEDDVSGWRYNPETKSNDWVTKDFDHRLVLTSVGQYSFEKDTPDYYANIFFGDIDTEGMYFKGDHWFRVKTQDFRDDIDYWRFYKKFRDQLTGEAQKKNANFSKTIYYVPTYDDFVPAEYGDKANFHFPIWFLDILIADGVAEEGLRLTKPNQPGVPFTTQEQYEDMLRIFEERKEKEDFYVDEQIKEVMKEHAELKKKERTRYLGSSRHYNHINKKMEKEIQEAKAGADKMTLSELKSAVKQQKEALGIDDREPIEAESVEEAIKKLNEPSGKEQLEASKPKRRAKQKA